MKTKYIILAAIPLLAATACSKKDQKAPEEMTPDIDVAQVQTDSIVLSKSYPGTLGASSSVDIVGRVNGYLLSQNYKDGETVQKGQVLFQIESTQYADAVQQAKATLENAQSQWDYASKNYAAMTKALESDAVSQIEVLQAKNAMESARAAIDNAKAVLQTAQTNLGYCTVRAPFSGTVTKGVFTPGTYIAGAGAPVTLATIYDNTLFNADFAIEDAAYIKAFTENQNQHLIDYNNIPVKFSEALPHQYTGHLDYIAPEVDTSTGTLSVRVKVQSPYGELKDGMYATIDLPYAVEPHALLVKDAAISSSQNRNFLYVVTDSNTVVYTPVVLGEMANDSMRIITSGLDGHERYVTKALLKVRPGMKVHPVMTK